MDAAGSVKVSNPLSIISSSRGSIILASALHRRSSSGASSRGSVVSTVRGLSVASASAPPSVGGVNIFTDAFRVLAAMFRTALYTGVVDYNHLESSFLISAVTILMLGMVFSSKGFQPGSVGYNMLTFVTAALIVASSVIFASLLSFEVYRSLKLSTLDAVARQLEVARAETALTGGSGPKGGARRGARRRTSVMTKFQGVVAALSKPWGASGITGRRDSSGHNSFGIGRASLGMLRHGTRASILLSRNARALALSQASVIDPSRPLPLAHLVAELPVGRDCVVLDGDPSPGPASNVRVGVVPVACTQ
jgi:hypothetical protein